MQIFTMDNEPTLQKFINFILRNRIRISFIIFGTLLCEDLLFEGMRPHHLFRFKDIVGLFGLILIIIGIGLRSWAAGIIYKREKLATSGPYSLTRHPLYAGSFFMALGFCKILADKENIWVIFALFLFIYFPKILEEESFLAKKYGEQWMEYTRQTTIFFPKKIPKIKSKWSLAQWIKNREYRAFITSVVATVILELLSYYPLLDFLKIF
ncbi:MAG: methyltransferase family protein [bacterium]